MRALALLLAACTPSVQLPPDLARAPADLAVARPDGLLARGSVCCECAPRVLACDGCEGALDLPRYCFAPCLDCARANGFDVGAFAAQYEAARGDADEARCRAGCPLE